MGKYDDLVFCRGPTSQARSVDAPKNSVIIFSYRYKVITSERILIVFSANFFQVIFEKKDRSYAFNEDKKKEPNNVGKYLVKAVKM
jgi:hypothetical protein